MHLLKGIFGIAYSCSSVTNKYCDDWYTTKYKGVYNNPSSKRSVQHARNLGFNNLRTYYLKPDQDHSDFLNLCDQQKIGVEIGISNDLLDQRNSDQITKIINNVRRHPSVKIYTVGNEYFGNLDNIVWGINYVYSMDNSKYIMHSSIFDQNFQTAANVYQKIPSHIKDKYIVGINMYFYGNPPNDQGKVIENVLRDFYNHAVLKNSYLIISEYGRNDDSWLAIWNFLWGNNECLKKYEKYLGVELFSFINENWKSSANGENNYGILTEVGDPKNTYWAVNDFVKNDEFKKNVKTALF